MAKRKKTRLPAASAGLRKIRATPGLSAKIAKAFKISRQAVSDWDKVPITRLAQVERITGIPRDRLRPDIFRRRR